MLQNMVLKQQYHQGYTIPYFVNTKKVKAYTASTYFVPDTKKDKASKDSTNEPANKKSRKA